MTGDGEVQQRFRAMPVRTDLRDVQVLSVGSHNVNALVFDVVPSEALTEADLHEKATLRDVVALIARVHRDVTFRLRGPVPIFWVFLILRVYAAFLRECQSPDAPKLDLLLIQAGILERTVGKVGLVPGHTARLPADILRREYRLSLIDWEYGGCNTPLFDLGGLAGNAGLPRQAERLMLAANFGAPPDQDLIRSHAATKCASILREAMWNMVSELTSDIDFDHGAHTADCLDRIRAAPGRFPTGDPL